MDFEYTDDQKLLRKTVAQFVDRSSDIERARKLREDERGWDTATWKQMAEVGWLSLPFSEEGGGLDASFVEVALILEQFGRTLVPEPYIPSVVLAGTAIALGGDGGQHERFLAPMMEGDTSLALAYAERDGRFDVSETATEARADGDAFVLDGDKVWVLNGHVAEHLVVSAKLDGQVALFVVDAGTPGLEVTRLKSIDGRPAAHVALRGVRVEADRRLPKGDLALLEKVLDHGAAAAVAEGVGVGQQVLDMTVTYLNEREQFGVKIGSFQALQHRAVDMFVEAQLLRSVSMASMLKVEDEDTFERSYNVSAAKVQLSVGGKFITRQSIQLFGGIGVTDEHDIGLYFKRMHVLNTLFGDEDAHLRRYAGSEQFAAMP